MFGTFCLDCSQIGTGSGARKCRYFVQRRNLVGYWFCYWFSIWKQLDTL